jgi:predicted SnoaL-like aldol condensation-catalyzing enzyme
MNAAEVPEPTCDPVPQSQLEANKQLLVAFFDSRPLSPEERSERFQTEDYVQHNPRFLKLDEQTGARGRQAWVRAYQETIKRGIKGVELNGIRLENPPVILIAECDLVTAIYRGTLTDPDDPSRTYEAFAFETVRVRNGKFSEHWDQVTLTAGWMNGER